VLTSSAANALTHAPLFVAGDKSHLPFGRDGCSVDFVFAGRALDSAKRSFDLAASRRAHLQRRRCLQHPLASTALPVPPVTEILRHQRPRRILRWSSGGGRGLPGSARSSRLTSTLPSPASSTSTPIPSGSLRTRLPMSPLTASTSATTTPHFGYLYGFTSLQQHAGPTDSYLTYMCLRYLFTICSTNCHCCKHTICC
jgi:hypothetical protein